MKKFIAILLIALCFLTACGEGSESKAPAKNDSAGNATDNGSADTENSGNDDKKDETAIDDGLPTVFMPTAVYFSPERSEKDVNKIEYDEFGNMTVFTNIGETYNKVNKSEINFDDQGRVTKVKNYHRDVYFFEYAEDGSLSKITGSLNYGNDSFTFERSPKEGSAYQLTVYSGKNYRVEQYDASYRMTEQLYYKSGTTTDPFHRRYITYGADGKITKWEKAYDDRYDFTNNYTAADFDEMGHCLTQYKIKGPNMVFSEYTYNWTCQTEKDASGKIIKDVHTCPDVTMAITFGYKYDGDKLTEYSYEVVDSKTNSYFCFVYTPVKVKCDSLQIALMNIYSNHAYSNNVTSFYGITTDWSK